MSIQTKPPLNYQLRRSRRRTLAVYVRDQQVEVRSPWHMRKGDIEQFVEQQADWIQRQLQQQAKQAAEKLAIAHGASIWYKARECRLVFVDGAVPGVEVDNREIRIRGRHLADDPARAAEILRRWLMQQAQDWLAPRTQALVNHMGLQDRFHEVVFRKTRSKWGHCTAEGRIQYNWLIMLAPDAVIDYMICHEVCHLVHMNHSREYWQLVARYCPDYSCYKGWLQAHGHRLWF